MAPLSPLGVGGSHGAAREQKNPPDKSTPGAIRGRKTRGLIRRAGWVR
jgi:hypothetical protein